MFQRVCCEDGVSGLGGASDSSLVNGTNPELVHRSFLKPKHRVVAHFLNVHVAAYPFTPSNIMSEGEENGRKEAENKQISLRGQK